MTTYYVHEKTIGPVGRYLLSKPRALGTSAASMMISGDKASVLGDIKLINKVPFVIPFGTYTLSLYTQNGNDTPIIPYKVGFTITHVYSDSGEPNQSNKYISGSLLDVTSNSCTLFDTYNFIQHDPLLVNKKITVGNNTFQITDNDIIHENDVLYGNWLSPDLPTDRTFISDINSGTIVPYTKSNALISMNPQFITMSYTVTQNIMSFGNADWIILNIYFESEGSCAPMIYRGLDKPIKLYIPF